MAHAGQRTDGVVGADQRATNTEVGDKVFDEDGDAVGLAGTGHDEAEAAGQHDEPAEEDGGMGDHTALGRGLRRLCRSA